MIPKPVCRFVAPSLLLAAAVFTAAAPVHAGRPLFAWRVQSPTATITMMGSIHVGRRDFYPLAPVIETAFAGSGALAVEVDVLAPDSLAAAAKLMMTEGQLPEGKTLDDVLPDSLLVRVQAEFADQPGAWQIYRKLRPAFLALVLTSEQYSRLGLDPQLGLENHFLTLARGRKSILELETLAQQMSLFTDLDDELARLLLREALDELPNMAGELEALIKDWQAGDVDRVDSLLARQVGEDPRLEGFYRAILDDRNVKMARTIADWLGQDRDIFVLVGAGHFAGDKGIVQLLRDRGLQVTQLER